MAGPSEQEPLPAAQGALGGPLDVLHLWVVVARQAGGVLVPRRQ